MHSLGCSGQLRGTAEQLCRLARCSPAEMVQALTELQDSRAADIEERNGIYLVTNRRMRREYLISTSNARRQQKFRENGGGDPERWTAIRVCILRRDDHRCAYCGKRASTVDHVLPRSKGGDESFSNLVACCSICNSRKCDRTLAECSMSFHSSYNQNNLQISNAEVTALVTRESRGRSNNEDRRSEIGEDQKRVNGERSSKRTKDVNRSPLTRSQEEALMQRLANALGDDEMATNGGAWLSIHIRKHPELLERGVAEIERMLKEQIPFHKNAAACLQDLLKRWAK